MPGSSIEFILIDHLKDQNLMPDTPDLVALLGSRICHDLISPIGAIGNGVELLMMDGSTMGPEIALISESVANANARIRFFRVAFGTSSGDQRIGRPEVLSILSDLTRGGRLTIDWRGPADLPRREVKLAFLLIQCFETAMAFGGRITVDLVDSHWLLTGEAAKLKLDADLWETLSNPAAKVNVTAAQVHFALVPGELKRQDRHLTADIGPTLIRLGF
jgi:histidine phosphotransferase ChpT